MRVKIKLIWSGWNGTGTNSRVAMGEFSAVAEGYRAQIFRFLLCSLGDRERANSMAEECSLTASRNLPRVRDDSITGISLMRIAIKLQKGYWQRRRLQFWRTARSHSLEPDLPSVGLPSGGTSPEHRSVALEQVDRVWRAVRNMREQERTAFLLRFVEDLDPGAIARTIGQSESTVKTLLLRALAQVQMELEKGRDVCDMGPGATTHAQQEVSD